MPRKPNRPKKNEPSHVHVVLPSDVTEKVDAYAAELQRVNPGSRVTRSEVVRRAVYQFLNLEG